MLLINALIACALPVFTLITPGIFIFKQPQSTNDLLKHYSRSLLFNTAFLILGTLVITFFKLPIKLFFLVSLFIIILSLFLKRKEILSLRPLFSHASFLVIFLTLYLLFSLPFLFYHSGLPTGDSQKSIYWANTILTNSSLPEYNTSLEKLNRDPVDFFTPGLHTATAYLMSFSDTNNFQLMTIGFFSIAASLSLALVSSSKSW